VKHIPSEILSSPNRPVATLLATGLMSLSLAGAASAANILLNPGFELGTGADADNWAEFGSPPAGTTARQVLQPFSGDFHIYMKVDNLNNPPAGVALFAEQIQGVGSIDNSLNYNLSFYAKSDTTDFTGVNMFYQLQWLDQDGSDGGGLKGEILNSLVDGGINTTYQQFVLNNINVPDGADSFLLRFQLAAGAVDDIVQGLSVDNAVLEAVPEPSSLSLLALAGLFAMKRRRA
jgi:hypothetical protein